MGKLCLTVRVKNIVENGRKCWLDYKTVEKGENAGFQQFSPFFSTAFLKHSLSEALRKK